VGDLLPVDPGAGRGQLSHPAAVGAGSPGRQERHSGARGPVGGLVDPRERLRGVAAVDQLGRRGVRGRRGSRRQVRGQQQREPGPGVLRGLVEHGVWAAPRFPDSC